jgi:hypothetical protein
MITVEVQIVPVDASNQYRPEAGGPQNILLKGQSVEAIMERLAEAESSTKGMGARFCKRLYTLATGQHKPKDPTIVELDKSITRFWQ